MHRLQSEEQTDGGLGYCLEKLPESDATGYTLDVDSVSRDLVEATVHALPVSPDGISHLMGPALEVTRVDTHTADIKIIHGFRAHFGTPSKKGRFTNCLIQAPGQQLKARVLHRGSLSFSDLSDLESANRALEVRGKGQWCIDKHEIQLGQRIAVGGFAEVFVAEYQGTIVAVKRLFDRDEAAIEQFQREVAILAKLRHPNLILFMGYCRSPELCIVSEFMHKGCLFSLLREHDGQPMDGPYIEAILVSVARAMAYLHSRSPPILHLDLKSPNILIDNAWRVKVTDFGLSRLRNRTLVSGNGGTNGTPHWMSPESIRGEKINEKSDVYSYGVIVWELLTGRAPWERLNTIQVIATVGFKNNRLPTPDHPDDVLVNLMTSCCSENPNDRPSFPEILDILDAHYRQKPVIPRIRTMAVSPSDTTAPSSPAVGTIVEVFSGTDDHPATPSKDDRSPLPIRAPRRSKSTDRMTTVSTSEFSNQGQDVSTADRSSEIKGTSNQTSTGPMHDAEDHTGKDIDGDVDRHRSLERLEVFERMLRSQRSAPECRMLTSPFSRMSGMPMDDVTGDQSQTSTEMAVEAEPSGETPTSTFEFSPFAAFTAVPFSNSGSFSERQTSGEGVTVDVVEANGITGKVHKGGNSDEMDGYPSLTSGGHAFHGLEVGIGDDARSNGKDNGDAWRIKVADVEDREDEDRLGFGDDTPSRQLPDEQDTTSESDDDEPSIDLPSRSDPPPAKRRFIPPLSFLRGRRFYPSRGNN